MALLTITDLKEHVETDLPDAALQRILDAAEQRILDAAGAHPSTTLTEEFDFPGYIGGRTRSIFATREINAISEIREREHFDDDSTTTLATDDYERRGKRELVRLRDGTNPRLYWAPITEVDYTPVDDTEQRKAVQVDLAKAMLNFQGFDSERIGDFQASHLSPDQLATILKPLIAAGKRMPLR